jgi:hypothetical protein
MSYENMFKDTLEIKALVDLDPLVLQVELYTVHTYKLPQ